MTGTDYAINYEDERFTKVEADKNEALTEVEKTYGDMIGQSDGFYQQQIDASKQWADKQSQLQQEQTDFAIEQIEQQKEQSQKDYVREQAGAYTDWQKQSNPYGAAAEKMAASGLTGTGFSESSQVSMYNTYQNRVATARESYNRAILNYNNAIKDARLQNNAALAEIAFQALQQQLELSLQGFQYKNSLILDQANKKMEVDNMYYNRYQDVLQQINNENALAEQIRQYNQNYELQMKQFEESIRQFNEEIARLKANDARAYSMQIKELELKKQQLEEEKENAQNAYISYTSTKPQSPKQTAQDIVNSSKTVQTGNEPINMDSVTALGLGPVTAATLNELETKGLITSYVKDGQRYFKKVTQDKYQFEVNRVASNTGSTYLTGGTAVVPSGTGLPKYLTG